MPPEIRTALRINPVRLEESVDEALRLEACHVLSGRSDHDTGVTDPLSTLPLDHVAPQFGQPTREKASGKKEKDKLRRQQKRAQRRAENPSIPRFSNSKKFAGIETVFVDYNAADLPAAKGAFVSQRQTCNNPREWTLEELLERGFKVVDWDGR